MGTKIIDIKALNIDRVQKKLQEHDTMAAKALKATGADIARRAPGWVGSEVTAVYSIKKGEVTPSKSGKSKTAGTIKVEGQTVSDITISYTGRLLTPTHFKMKPTARPQPRINKKGDTVPAKAYQVSAEIKKGARKVLGSAVFLGGNKGGTDIPFVRTTGSSYPIKSVKTLSLPQMIDNDQVSAAISDKIGAGLMERLKHNMERFSK